MSRSSRLAHRLAAIPSFSLTTVEFKSALRGSWRAKQKVLVWLKQGGRSTIPEGPHNAYYDVVTISSDVDPDKEVWYGYRYESDKLVERVETMDLEDLLDDKYWWQEERGR